MSFVMIPEELLEVNISAAQLRALIHIINNTYSSGKYAGCCCLGYQNLANLCFTNKPVMIKIVQQLEELGFIEINRRERFNRSNAIKLTLENGYERCRGKIGGCSCSTDERYLKHTDERYLKDTDERYLKHTEGYLKDTQGYLKDTPHIDLKFKNQDLKNINTEQGYLKDTFDKSVAEGDQIAPADVAAGRSMPGRGQAARGSAKEVQAQALAAKDADLELLDAMKAKFADIFADLSLSKAGNTYILRKKGKYALIEDVRLREVVYWICARGLDARIMDESTRVLGEVLLGEVA